MVTGKNLTVKRQHKLEYIWTQDKSTSVYHICPGPWLDSSIHAILKERDAANRSGDTQAYSVAWRNLKMGIKNAKLHIKEHMNDRACWLEQQQSLMTTDR